MTNGQPIMSYDCLPYKTINEKSLNFKPQFQKNLLRSDYFTIRFENNIHSQYKIQHKFSLQDNSNSNI